MHQELLGAEKGPRQRAAGILMKTSAQAAGWCPLSKMPVTCTICSNLKRKQCIPLVHFHFYKLESLPSVDYFHSIYILLDLINLSIRSVSREYCVYKIYWKLVPLVSAIFYSFIIKLQKTAPY